MFEQEIEMEKKEGSAFGPVLIILVLVGLFVGSLGVVVFQSKQTLKPEEATAAVDKRLRASAPITVSFHTGMVSYTSADNPSDPQYKLLENAGILKLGKAKGRAAQVDLTPSGKEFLASLPNVQTIQDKDHTTLYVLPLASRKLVSVDKIIKLSHQKFQIQYRWAWQTTKAGEMFDVDGKLVQSLPSYDRSVLINQHGANYYHSAPGVASMLLVKGDTGWDPLSAN